MTAPVTTRVTTHRVLYVQARGRALAVHALCALLRRRLLPTDEAAGDAVLALRGAAATATAGLQPQLYNEVRVRVRIRVRVRVRVRG